MPAYHSEEFACDLPESEAKERLSIAAENIGWSILDEKDGNLIFRVPFNALSYGEEVKVNFKDNIISLHSECRSPTQLFDFGKNRRNCVKLLKAAGF